MEMRIAIAKRQQGAVLIMALLLLLVMTILGVSAMQGTAMEERMAGNAHDHNMAFQSAESGLRDAGEWLTGLAGRPLPDAGGASGINPAGSVAINSGDYAFDWAAYGMDYGANTSNSAADFPYNAAVPKYVVEETAFVPDSLNPESMAQGAGRYYYTVSAIGYGGTGSSEAVLQAVYEKRYQ